MLSIDVGKVSRHPAPAGPVGDESFPQAAQQPLGLTPSELPRAACPINPRPRNQRAYNAACAAAQGEPVREYDAFEVEEGMRAWCGGSFLTVTDARHMHLGDFEELHRQFNQTELAHPFVLLLLTGPGTATGWIIGDLDTPVYVLASTPDAIHAPGAEASADKSTRPRA